MQKHHFAERIRAALGLRRSPALVRAARRPLEAGGSRAERAAAFAERLRSAL
jgi:hypothetical protein